MNLVCGILLTICPPISTSIDDAMFKKIRLIGSAFCP